VVCSRGLGGCLERKGGVRLAEVFKGFEGMVTTTTTVMTMRERDGERNVPVICKNLPVNFFPSFALACPPPPITICPPFPSGSAPTPTAATAAAVRIARVRISNHTSSRFISQKNPNSILVTVRTAAQQNNSFYSRRRRRSVALCRVFQRSQSNPSGLIPKFPRQAKHHAHTTPIKHTLPSRHATHQRLPPPHTSH
jgi:hypothetical protein